MSIVDSNIRDLMRETVAWEQAGAGDRYTDNAYAAPVTIACFIEPEGFAGGGASAIRRSDESVVDPSFDIYFDGSDANVQLFTVNDFFSVSGEQGGAPLRTQPLRITDFFAPDGSPWLRVVTL